MKKTILIVEDDQFMQTILKKKLISDGFKILEAFNGLQGLRIAIEKTPDLILLDIIMPKTDGLLMLEELKESEKAKNIPVIILTNTGDNKKIDKAIQLDAIRYLIKDSSILNNVSSMVKEELNL